MVDWFGECVVFGEMLGIFGEWDVVGLGGFFVKMDNVGGVVKIDVVGFDVWGRFLWGYEKCLEWKEWVFVELRKNFDLCMKLCLIMVFMIVLFWVIVVWWWVFCNNLFIFIVIFIEC